MRNPFAIAPVTSRWRHAPSEVNALIEGIRLTGRLNTDAAVWSDPSLEAEPGVWLPVSIVDREELAEAAQARVKAARAATRAAVAAYKAREGELRRARQALEAAEAEQRREYARKMAAKRAAEEKAEREWVEEEARRNAERAKARAAALRNAPKPRPPTAEELKHAQWVRDQNNDRLQMEIRDAAQRAAAYEAARRRDIDDKPLVWSRDELLFAYAEARRVWGDHGAKMWAKETKLSGISVAERLGGLP